MNDIQAIGQSEIEMKIKEAETCHSMGMIREALQVYEQILTGLPGQNSQIRDTISAKIGHLLFLRKRYPAMMMSRRCLTGQRP
jgi:hypothetical protein